jgi:DNA-binding beta-propeller fold protein YncE
LPLLPLIAGERVPCVEQLGETHPPIPRSLRRRVGRDHAGREDRLHRQLGYGHPHQYRHQHGWQADPPQCLCRSDRDHAGREDRLRRRRGSLTGTIIPISTGTNTAGTPIRVGVSANVLAITRDGKTLYAAAVNRVIPISTATNTPGKPIHIPIRGAHPSAVITP